MKIREMDQSDLLELAEELGAHNSETFEESADRFRGLGDEETAAKFDRMTKRWFELE